MNEYPVPNYPVEKPGAAVISNNVVKCTISGKQRVFRLMKIHVAPNPSKPGIQPSDFYVGYEVAPATTTDKTCTSSTKAANHCYLITYGGASYQVILCKKGD